MRYVSSKLKHAQMWREARDNGMPIISSWIDGEKLEGSKALENMWDTYFTELKNCDSLVLYVEPGEVLKGALIEVGAVLADGKDVVVVFSGKLEELERMVGTWIHDACVRIVKDIQYV